MLVRPVLWMISSTSSYLTFFGCSLMIWRSKKQNVITRSSAKVEFKSMALRLCKALLLGLLLQDLGYISRQPVWLFYDSKLVCDIPHYSIQCNCIKYVELDKFSPK